MKTHFFKAQILWFICILLGTVLQCLVSLHPLWIDTVLSDLNELWCDSWELATVVTKSLVTDPTIRQPGFDFSRHTWCVLNRFCTGHVLYAVNVRKWA